MNNTTQKGRERERTSQITRRMERRMRQKGSRGPHRLCSLLLREIDCAKENCNSNMGLHGVALSPECHSCTTGHGCIYGKIENAEWQRRCLPTPEKMWCKGCTNFFRGAMKSRYSMDCVPSQEGINWKIASKERVITLHSQYDTEADEGLDEILA